jgi:hypothetical protein
MHISTQEACFCSQVQANPAGSQTSIFILSLQYATASRSERPDDCGGCKNTHLAIYVFVRTYVAGHFHATISFDTVMAHAILDVFSIRYKDFMYNKVFYLDLSATGQYPASRQPALP